MRRAFVRFMESGRVPSVRELARDVLSDAARLAHTELRLVREELRSRLRRAGRGGWLLASAALAGLLTAATMAGVCILAMAIVMPVWLAALFTGLLAGGAAFAGLVKGRTALEELDLVPHRAAQSLRKDAELLAGHR